MSEEQCQRKEDVLASAAKLGASTWVCWACGGEVKNPVVKRRRERGFAPLNRSHGVYHQRCKARWDA